MKVNQLKTGVVLSYFSLFLGNVIAIIYTPIMLRLLGQNEYGLYQLVGSVVSYLGLLSFGFGSAYIRHYSIYKVNHENEKIAKLNGMFIIIFSMIAVVSMIAGVILVINTQNIFGATLNSEEVGKAKILMSILTLNMALSFPFSVFNSYVIANEQYFFQRILNMVRTIVSPFIMLPVLLMGFKSVGMVVASTCISIIAEVINTVYCFKTLKMQFDFKKINFGLFKEISVFSSFIFFNMVVDQINWNVDKFLLGMLHGTATVAIYGIASQLNSYYMSFSTSVSSVFIPRIHQMVAESNDNKALTSLFIRVGRIQFIILSLIFSGFIFFGKPFIYIWAGKNYKDSYAIALMLIIPATIPLIQNVGIEIQRAKNLHKFRSILYLGIAIVNILLSIPLGKLYGGLGCAMGTAISLLIGNGLIMNIYYQKKVGLDIKKFWSEILRFVPAFIIPVIVGGILIRFIDLYCISYFLLSGLVYMSTFCVCIWRLGLNTDEKKLIYDPIKKIIEKCKGYNSDHNNR